MNDTIIHVGGQTFFRSHARAKLQLATQETMPKAIASTAEDISKQLCWKDVRNPDLVFVKFVLDTEGGNGNWDYMPRAQLIKSHATAIFKPIDMDHTIIEDNSMVGGVKDHPPVRNTICGVMTGTALAWASTGALMTEKEINDLPLDDDWHRKDEEKIAVVAWGALYQFLFPKTVANLTESINSGDMYVSMERWIGQLDYLVWDNDKKDFTAVDKATAEERGFADRTVNDIVQPGRWSMHQSYNNHPVYRRSLAYIYGGVANTETPANSASRFLPTDVMVRAAASAQGNIPLQSLLRLHDAIHVSFATASADRRKQLIDQHEQTTRAIARLTRSDAQ